MNENSSVLIKLGVSQVKSKKHLIRVCEELYWDDLMDEHDYYWEMNSPC